MVIGRREYCDIVIDHSSLSKRHCVMVKTDGLLVIRDLISTNGTKVKGQKIRWAALLPDDRITLGSYKIRVYLGPDDAPGPLELYRERARRAGSGPMASRGTRAREEGLSFSGTAGSANQRAATSPLPHVNGGFAQPSPMEFAAPSFEQSLPPQTSAGPGPAPAFPIGRDDDDDDDDIIELD
jgi:predicted component of type VI protein secretion system